MQLLADSVATPDELTLAMSLAAADELIDVVRCALVVMGGDSDGATDRDADAAADALSCELSDIDADDDFDVEPVKLTETDDDAVTLAVDDADADAAVVSDVVELAAALWDPETLGELEADKSEDAVNESD